MPFICFTDNPAVVSETWQIRPFQPMFPLDLHRSQRVAKLRPHAMLPDYGSSLYIDNSVILHRPPEAIFERFALESGLTMPAHSFRDTLHEEFLTVMRDRLDDPGRIAEQLEHYQACYPLVLQQRPFWSAIMLRDHGNETMRRAMEIWLLQICRYSRRDQLSSSMAFSEAGLQPAVMAIDNYRSWFHTWPHTGSRRLEQRIWREIHPRYYPVAEHFKLQLEILKLEQRVSLLRRLYEATLTAKVRRMLHSLRRRLGKRR